MDGGPSGPGTDQDRRDLRRLITWLGIWALVGFAFLVFSIWVDWS